MPPGPALKGGVYRGKEQAQEMIAATAENPTVLARHDQQQQEATINEGYADQMACPDIVFKY